MPFFLFELHNGDDNDNFIYDCIIEAPSKEDALNKVEEHIKDFIKTENLDPDGIDGDDSSVTFMYWEYYDEYGEEIELVEDISEDNEGVPFHFDFYLQGEYKTEDKAEENKSSFHGTYFI